jgi:RNA polymerase sigma factor (sigma-70 family)
LHAGGVAGEPVRVSEVFEAERSWLFGLAYRLLGSASDAEDVLQSAFERWIVADGTVVSPRMWLTTVVTNLCLKELASPRRRRERYTGTWLPEPVVTSGGALGPLETAEQRDSVSFAVLVLLERLSPPERAVFVLREAFGYSYGEIARVLGRSEAGCRQLHRRAGQRLGSGPRRVRPDRGQWRRLTEQFLTAAADGDVAGLEQLFAEDAGYVGDGEGSGLPVARKPVTGRSRLARFFAWVVPRYAADPRFTDVRLTVAEVNGQPAVLAWSRGSLLAVVIVDADRGMIAALWLVVAPGKLAVAARQAVSLPVEESLPWAGRARVPGHG